jgi:hypothetical protein
VGTAAVRDRSRGRPHGRLLRRARLSRVVTMPSDDLTFALALLGATTGTMSTATAIYAAGRDRPRVRLDGSARASIDKPPQLTFSVMNVGYRATTLRSVGFYAHKTHMKVYADEEAADADDWKYETEGEVHCVVAESIFLEPGEAKHFDATVPVLRMGVWTDEPLRAYAIDIRGRRLWGPAAPVVRILFGPDPPLDKLPDELRTILTTDTPEAFRLPAQVQPQWKLWKGRELRRPSAWKGGDAFSAACPSARGAGQAPQGVMNILSLCTPSGCV